MPLGIIIFNEQISCNPTPDKLAILSALICDNVSNETVPNDSWLSIPNEITYDTPGINMFTPNSPILDIPTGCKDTFPGLIVDEPYDSPVAIPMALMLTLPASICPEPKISWLSMALVFKFVLPGATDALPKEDDDPMLKCPIETMPGLKITLPIADSYAADVAFIFETPGMIDWLPKAMLEGTPVCPIRMPPAIKLGAPKASVEIIPLGAINREVIKLAVPVSKELAMPACNIVTVPGLITALPNISCELIALCKIDIAPALKAARPKFSALLMLFG